MRSGPTAVLFSGAVDRPDMERWKLAAWAGTVACLLTVLTVAAPYVVVGDPGVVPAYYGLGAVSPLTVVLLALVGTVAFAAAANERSDPELVAGLMLVAAAASLLVSVQWALSFGAFRIDVTTKPTYDLLAAHRWTVVATTALWTVASAWFAAALGLLGVTAE